MSQRTTTIAATVVAAASLVACGILWKMLDDSRRQHRELMSHLAAAPGPFGPSPARAGARGPVPDGKASGDWFPFSVKVTSADGKPAAARVTAGGTAIAGGKVSESAGTDAGGIADFGPLPAGEYRAFVILEEDKLNLTKSLLLGPGRPNRLEVVRPEAPGQASLTFDIQPPESLREIPLYYLANVRYLRHEVNGDSWSVAGGGRGPVYLIGTDGKVLGQTDYDKITYHDDSGLSSGYSINFLEKIPTDFPFEPAKDVKAYTLNVDLWPAVRDPDGAETDGDGRPPLVRLSGVALQRLAPLVPTPGQPCVVRVDPRQTEFWNKVAKDLRLIPKYRSLAAAGRD